MVESPPTLNHFAKDQNLGISSPPQLEAKDQVDTYPFKQHFLSSHVHSCRSYPSNDSQTLSHISEACKERLSMNGLFELDVLSRNPGLLNPNVLSDYLNSENAMNANQKWKISFMIDTIKGNKPKISDEEKVDVKNNFSGLKEKNEETLIVRRAGKRMNIKGSKGMGPIIEESDSYEAADAGPNVLGPEFYFGNGNQSFSMADEQIMGLEYSDMHSLVSPTISHHYMSQFHSTLNSPAVTAFPNSGLASNLSGYHNHEYSPSSSQINSIRRMSMDSGFGAHTQISAPNHFMNIGAITRRFSYHDIYQPEAPLPTDFAPGHSQPHSVKYATHPVTSQEPIGNSSHHLGPTANNGIPWLSGDNYFNGYNATPVESTIEDQVYHDSFGENQKELELSQHQAILASKDSMVSQDTHGQFSIPYSHFNSYEQVKNLQQSTDEMNTNFHLFDPNLPGFSCYSTIASNSAISQSHQHPQFEIHHSGGLTSPTYRSIASPKKERKMRVNAKKSRALKISVPKNKIFIAEKETRSAELDVFMETNEQPPKPHSAELPSSKTGSDKVSSGPELVPEVVKSTWSSAILEPDSANPCLMMLSEALYLLSLPRDKSYPALIHSTNISCPYPTCAHTFSSLTLLQDHLKCHEPTRPFTCTQCPSMFRRRQDLMRHYKIHTQIKPFSCKWCEKMFSRKDAQLRHSKICRNAKASEKSGENRDVHLPSPTQEPHIQYHQHQPQFTDIGLQSPFFQS